MKRLSVNLVDFIFACMLVLVAYSDEIGNECESLAFKQVFTWQFAIGETTIVTNCTPAELFDLLGDCKTNVEQIVILQSQDGEVGGVRGGIMAFDDYSKLYSALYARISESTMPMDLLLTSLDIDLNNGIGDVLIVGKHWDEQSARFIATKTPRYAFVVKGHYLVH